MSFKEPWIFQFKIFMLKNSLLVLLLIFVMSPIITWGVAHLNLYILKIFAFVYVPFPASTFISSTMIGLITLLGVSLTIIWNYHLRQRELATQKVYVVDKVLEELIVNNKIAKQYLKLKVKSREVRFIPSFVFKNWIDLAEMATLLPRDLYTTISVIYKRLKKKRVSGNELTQVQLLMEDAIEKLYLYRKELRTLYEVRMSKEDKQVKKEFEKAYKRSCNANSAVKE